MENRNQKLDLIRCMAILSVLCVHFFLNTSFYNTSLNSIRMFIMTIMRTSFMVCVPLFLLLTGYLCNKKIANISFYKKLFRIIGIFIIISIFIQIHSSFLLYFSGNKSPLSPFVDFHCIRYSWYFEMYLGLFLLIPFLNLLYKNLPDKKAKLNLILTLLTLTTFPTILNVLPSWWTNLYPVTYYFIGSYLSEYKINISSIKSYIIFLASILFFGVLNYIISFSLNDTKMFLQMNFSDWFGIQNVILSVLLFISILNLKSDNFYCFNKTIKTISKYSYGIYLASSLSDQVVYSYFNFFVPSMLNKIFYFPIVVFTTFIIAFGMSVIAEKCYKKVELVVTNINKK